MYCDGCRTELPEGASVCPACGKPALGTAARSSGLARHFEMLGILWSVYGAWHVLKGIIMWYLRGMATATLTAFAPLAVLLVLSVLLLALAGLVAGWGLLQWKRWARGLALFVALPALLNFPWGTVLGVYSLWVLLPERAGQEYRRLAGGA